MTDVQVLIVGAGPTGLALAVELERFRLSYRLIDRSLHAAQWSQALVVQARTLEQFERYQIAETAVARGRKIHQATIFSEQRQVVQLNFDRVHSRYPFILFLPQNETERLLIEHLNDLGGVIERGIELVAFDAMPDEIVATLRHADGQSEQVTAAWLVGCDGAHSIVRHGSGVHFEGTTVDREFLLADLHITGDDVPGDELRVYLHRGTVVFIGRLTDTVCRVIVVPQETTSTSEGEHTLELGTLQSAVDLCVGTGMRLSDPTWMTRFHINQRKARHYRIGRVFLAGDAAHIHSPVAGQGMNTGIQDVANLAWKLASVTRGAPEALLDSYDQERGAVGDLVVSATGRGLAAAMTANPTLEMIRDHVLGLLGDLSFVQERARGFISETALNYRGSRIVQDHGGGSRLHAGDRAPDVTFHDAHGTEHRLAEWFATPDHLLLALDVTDAQVQTLANVWSPAHLLQLASAANDELARTYGARGKPIVYALRPDGYIGFRGSPDDAALHDYARRVGVM